MDWDVSGIDGLEDVYNKIREDLVETLPIAFEKEYGVQPMSDGSLMPQVAPSELGTYSEATQELHIERYASTGIFTIVSGSQNGTNVMANQIEVMRVFLKEASGAIRINRRRLQSMAQGSTSDSIGMNDASSMAKGWKTYIELNGYQGQLNFGLQGLFTLPFGEYSFSAPANNLTGDAFLDQLQLAISAHESVFADSDLKRLAVPTRIYNLMKSKKIAGSGVSVMKTFLEDNSGFEIVKVPQFDGANAGQDIAFLLPYDADKLALVVDPSIRLSRYNEKSNLIIEGYVGTALAVCKNPGCGLRITGL
jgi:hypothetical protein